MKRKVYAGVPQGSILYPENYRELRKNTGYIPTTATIYNYNNYHIKYKAYHLHLHFTWDITYTIIGLHVTPYSKITIFITLLSNLPLVEIV